MIDPKQDLNHKESELFSSTLLLDFPSNLKRKKNIQGVLVVEKGAIVFESYASNYTSTDRFSIASVTKSVLSMLIGIAIEKEYIKSVDESVMSFFPEYNMNRDYKRNAITLHHLLSMTAPFPFPTNAEPFGRMCRQKDWVKYGLELMGKGGDVGVFKYSSIGAHILSAVLTKATGMSARAFANKHLFEPLGITDIDANAHPGTNLDDTFGKDVRGWVHDPLGYSTGGWGLTLTLHDMARIGLLYARNGLWHDTQVISESWIIKTMTPYSKGHSASWWHYEGYGYLWATKTLNESIVYCALGSGGNAIYAMPDKDVVIAVAANPLGKEENAWDIVEYLFKENI